MRRIRLAVGDLVRLRSGAYFHQDITARRIWCHEGTLVFIESRHDLGYYVRTMDGAYVAPVFSSEITNVSEPALELLAEQAE